MKNRLLLIIGAAGIAVCTTPVAPCACVPLRTHVLVYGSVRTSTGASVGDAQVVVIPAPLGAPAGDSSQSRSGSITKADGSYRVEAISLYSPTESLAVRGLAVRAPGDTARAATVGGSLRPLEKAADSVRLDIVFP